MLTLNISSFRALRSQQVLTPTRSNSAASMKVNVGMIDIDALYSLVCKGVWGG